MGGTVSGDFIKGAAIGAGVIVGLLIIGAVIGLVKTTVG
jgi:hypothetical protein